MGAGQSWVVDIEHPILASTWFEHSSINLVPDTFLFATWRAPKGPVPGSGPWANVLAKFPARLVIEHEKEHDTAVYSIQWYSAPSVEALYRYLDGASDENVRMVANISLPMERLEKFARPYKVWLGWKASHGSESTPFDDALNLAVSLQQDKFCLAVHELDEVQEKAGIWCGGRVPQPVKRRMHPGEAGAGTEDGLIYDLYSEDKGCPSDPRENMHLVFD